MITTVTLNPCFDRTLSIEKFSYGEINRAQESILEFSGKGYNVARVLAHFGCKVCATGFLFHENGQIGQEILKKEGVQLDCIWKDGAIRTNYKIFDRSKSVITEFNEPGVAMSQQDQTDILGKIVEHASKSKILVLSGSLPPECPVDFYGQIISACRGLACKIVLDAEGEKLKQGIKQHPDLIKPNVYELSIAVNRDLKSKNQIADAAEEMMKLGAGAVIVSMGKDGTFFTNGEESYFARNAAKIEVLGTVGAGDSLVAGVCKAWDDDLPWAERLRFGIASSTACVVQKGSALAKEKLVESFLPEVNIQKWK